MAFGVGDELSVRISASTADFEAGVSSAKREAGSLSRRLSRLGDTSEETADSIQALAITSAAASGALSGLGIAANLATFNLSALSTTVTGALIPAVVLLSTTAAPIVGTLGALAAGAASLAGAFGLVIGTGILAFGKQLSEQNKAQLRQTKARIETLKNLKEIKGELSVSQQQELKRLKKRKKELQDATSVTGALSRRLSQLKDTLTPLIAAFGRQFAPLIRDAINAIPQLVRNILQAVGGVDRFAAALRSLGSQAANALPSIVGGFFDLARKALPIFLDFVTFLSGRGSNVIGSFINTAERLSDEFLAIGDAVLDILPTVNKFGTQLLEQILPVVDDAIRGFGNLLNRIMAFTQTQQFQKIMDAVRQAMVELGPEITELQQNLGILFERLVKNGPAIIRGLTALLDGLLDLVNAATPILEAFIVLTGQVMNAIGLLEGLQSRGSRIGESVDGGISPASRSTFAGENVAPRRNQQQQEIGLDLAVSVETDDEMIENTAVRVTRRQQRQQSQRYFAETGNINTNE